MRGVVVIALVAGCAEPGAVVPGKVFLTRPMNEYQVNGTAYQMNFPPDDGDRGGGVQLPNALYLGGDNTNALGTGMCPNESLVGIGLYPTAIAAGDPAGNAGTGGIDVVHGTTGPEGTGVLSLAVHYDIPYSCDTESEVLTGTTTFTFFPSSRIVRHDVVTGAAANVVGITDCPTCAPTPDGWYFTSFWTMNTSTVFNRTGGTFNLGNFQTPVPEACVQIGNNVVAIDWLGQQPTRAMRPSPTSSAVVYDFQRGGLDLMSGMREVTSSLQFGFNLDAETECNNLLGALTTAPIKVNGTRAQMNPDGIYVDREVHNGTIELTAEDGDVAPFAIMLDLGSNRHARVSRPYGEYTIQDIPSTPDNDNDFLFWFDGGLSNFAETITIEPY